VGRSCTEVDVNLLAGIACADATAICGIQPALVKLSGCTVGVLMWPAAAWHPVGLGATRAWRSGV
jgi:hypothetical protein